MAKAIIHAKSSVKKFGGKVEDYLPIHELMDSSKTVISDNRHRALTHNSWFINTIVARIFGEEIINSNGKAVPVKEIAEQHVLEDFQNRFIPSAQDFLQNLKYETWMNGAGNPPSLQSVFDKANTFTHKFIQD